MFSIINSLIASGRPFLEVWWVDNKVVGEGKVDSVKTGSELGPFLDPCKHNNILLSFIQGIPRISVVPNDTEKYYCLWQTVWYIMWRKKLYYTHSLAYAVVTLWKVWCNSHFAQGRIQYMYWQLYQVHSWKSSWYPNSNIQEPDQP